MNQNKWLRFLLSEITTLPPVVFYTLEKELDDSDFWLEPHTDDDIKNKKSPLTIKLQAAINSAFAKAGLNNTTAKIYTIKGTEKPEDSISWLAGASHTIVRGKHFVDLMIYPFPDEDFELNVEMLVDEIGEVIRHELIHAGQLEKQAKRKKTSLTKANIERSSDKYQISQASQTDPQAEEVYHSRKIEIEAYAHQMADYLVKYYEPEEIAEIISMPIEEMPDDVKSMQVWKPLSKNPKALKRFRNRLYAYVQHLTEN